MGSKRTLPVLTTDRLARLYRMLLMLAKAPQGRAAMLRRLNLDVRGFYRDLETLRQLGIPMHSEGGRYRLLESIEQSAKRLPFPDPGLNLHEAMVLAKGGSPAHRKLREQIRQLTGNR
jgi:predicted DNA-binding transcriptional regulator YafY